MKNKFFLAIVALVFSSGFAFGQNAHSMFESNSADIISAVTISDMNNYYHYMVGTDDDLKIFVTPLDYSTPFPQPDNANSRAFQLSDTYGKILLKGGFVDEEDNIVVYGYGDSDNRGVVIKITMSGQVAVAVRCRFLNYANSMIVDGCWSNVTTPATSLYNFVTTYNGGSFTRIKSNLVNVYPGLKINNGQICSVSWDDVEKMHVLSGNIDNYNAIGYIPGTLTLIPGNSVLHLLRSDDFYFSEGTNDHILAGNGYYYDSIAYLIQDIRNANGDGLWVTEMNYISGQVNYSNIYQFPSEKVLIIDAAHNFMNLFVLGHHNGFDGVENFEKRYIAQFDLYDPTNYIVKFMDDMDLDTIPWISTHYITKQAYLNNIIFDDGTYNVYSSGAVSDTAYLVETFDLNYDNCDSEIIVTMPEFDYVDSTMSAITQTHAYTTYYDVTSYSSYSLSASELCGGAKSSYNKACDEIKNIIDKKQAIYARETVDLTSFDEIAEIRVFDGDQFICNMFSGNIVYKIFDMSGRLVDYGKTENGVLNSVKINNSGMYIINAIDENNQTANAKIMISE